ncbi:hypothetical protein OOU_Y34scaffold00162g55 [Pyricularia oryzae Y34]|uniref:Prefoldin beta-like protein n=2 Tax=Pyricularia oryzae TaxID=318829 RepID=A0AA97P7D3_PYRO3|nr:hypothetical protein OOU_Y34scaffold00162g55 [Pyricularia oryzae Y34]
MASQQVSVKKQQELQAQYSTYKDTLQQVARKIGDVEQEAEEHKSVFAISSSCNSPLKVAIWRAGQAVKTPAAVTHSLLMVLANRKCFRLINGVLVERTVKDVVPALKTNAEGLRKVLEDLVKQYKGKEEEFEKWKKKNNVQVVQS